MSDVQDVPAAVRQVIETRASETTLPFALAFAEQALRRPVGLEAHTSDDPRYFRTVANGTTIAYARPRKDHGLVEYRLPHDHWAYGWGFGTDAPNGISLRIDGQTSFEVALRLLDDALAKLTA